MNFHSHSISLEREQLSLLLLVENICGKTSFSFCLSEKSISHLHFWKIFLLSVEFCADSYFLTLYFKILFHFILVSIVCDKKPPAVIGIIFPLYICFFFSNCSLNFPLMFGFQQFDSSETTYGFLFLLCLGFVKLFRSASWSFISYGKFSAIIS